VYDLLQISHDIWQNFDLEDNPEDENLIEIAKFGKLYPEILSNPKKYIVERSDLRITLCKLLEIGKLLFLLSNLHFEYLDLTMSISIGPDW
jgi:hypothetical protein